MSKKRREPATEPVDPNVVTEHMVRDAKMAIGDGMGRLFPPMGSTVSWKVWFREHGYPLPPDIFDPPADYDWGRKGATAAIPAHHDAFYRQTPAEQLAAWRGYAEKLDQILTPRFDRMTYVELVDRFAAEHTPWCDQRPWQERVVDPI